MTAYSVNPAGEKFPIPSEGEYAKEFSRIQTFADQARRKGRKWSW